ncbi:MAG: hypothetical protein ACRETW_06610, partial [Stenotrophobium sp.]
MHPFHWERVALCGLLLALLVGCGALPTRLDNRGNGADTSQNRAMHTDLIRDMLAQHQYYAALAHIEELKSSSGDTRELRFLEAETRRHLGQTAQSAALYQGLIDTEYEARAYHGLGLLNAGHNLPLAIRQLRFAVQRQPTDVQFRNDLGYAEMMAGQYQDALAELSTATELDQHSQLSRNNLVMLLYLMHDDVGARRVA